jgi:hypothetical protein
MPEDVDGVEAVEHLEDIRWDRKWKGLKQRQIGVTTVWMGTRNNWAVVLIAVQDWKPKIQDWGATRIVITRWRRERSAWRLFNNYRLPREVLASLAAIAPGFLNDCSEVERAFSCGSSQQTDSSP